VLRRSNISLYLCVGPTTAERHWDTAGIKLGDPAGSQIWHLLFEIHLL